MAHRADGTVSQPVPVAATKLSLAICVVGFAGVFASFSYVTPMMVRLAGYTPAAVTFLLALFGVGMTVGNLLGARFADRGRESVGPAVASKWGEVAYPGLRQTPGNPCA